jgi:hypothetical protein
VVLADPGHLEKACMTYSFLMPLLLLGLGGVWELYISYKSQTLCEVLGSKKRTENRGMGMEKCGNDFKYVYREKSFYCRQQDALQVRQQKLPSILRLAWKRGDLIY